ncbi:MAG: glycosyltransferase [Vicinamibacterales bacterium]
MRILFVVHGFPPEATGGTELYAATLAQALRRRGHEVVVFAREARPDEPEYRVRRDRAGEVDVVRVNHTFRDATSFEHTYRNARIDAIAGALLDDERPDLVHAHHLTCLSTGIVSQCAARGIPLVLTLNDYWLICHRGQLLDLDLARCDGPEAGRCAVCAGLAASGQPAVHAAARGLRAIERHLPKPLAAIQRRLVSGAARRVVPESAASEITRRLEHVRTVCDSAARILAPSKTLVERFARFGIPPSRMLLQDQGIDVRPFANLTREPADRLRLGFAGSLIASKAPHVLLEAVAGLPPDRVSLTIAGDLAPYHGDASYAGIVRPMLQVVSKPVLAASIDRRTQVLKPPLEKAGVEWLGGVAHEKVPALLASIDVLVVPSIWIENAPFVIKEAFAAGLPVVASNLGGMAELVQDGRNGLLFNAGDPDDLRRVITRLLDEPGLFATLREGIPRVKTIDEDAAWTQALYEEVVRESSARATVESGSVARSSGGGQPPHAGYETGPVIAAVVLNYNTPDDTLLAVLSLRASRRPFDQVVVVDNGAGTECERALSPWRDSVRYIRSPGNVGFSAGCNIGIRAALDAGADMVLLVNSDAVLAPDAVERLEHALMAEPGAGIAAPLVASRAEPGIVGSAGIAYSAATGRMKHEGFGGRTTDLCEGPVQTVDVVSGCVMLIRRSVFDRIGLFDERYFYSFEDIEFCLRARRAGHRILLVPQALAYHEGHQSIGAASASRLYYAARNHLLLAQSALPLTGLRTFVRAAGIVLLNVAYAVRVPAVPRLAALRAVISGTIDHMRGHYGPRPSR